MYQSKVNQEGRNATLQLDGLLTIQNAIAIKESIISILPKVDSLFINHDGAKEFDLTYIQILVSTGKSAEHSGKSILCSFPELFIAKINESAYSSVKWLSGNNSSISKGDK